MSQVSAAFLLDTAGCAPIYTKLIVGWCGFHPLGWASTETRPRHASPSTQMRPTRVDGRQRTPELEPGAPSFRRLQPLYDVLGRRVVGGGGGVDVRFHAVAALLLILRLGLAVMNGIPGLCGVVLSTQVKEQRIGRMGVGSRVIKRRLHEWPLRRSYQARIVAPALRSV